MRKVLLASALVLSFYLPSSGQDYFPLLHRQELLNAKTVYFEYCDPTINNNKPERDESKWVKTIDQPNPWELLTDYCYREFTKQFRKWCQEGRICWELVMDRERADLVLEEWSKKREKRDNTAHSLCLIDKALAPINVRRLMTCPPVTVKIVTDFRAVLTTKDGKVISWADTRADDILAKLQKRLGKVSKGRP